MVSPSLDPTRYRLSPQVLLSDILGCHSCYTHGYANPVYRSDRPKLAEFHYLAETLIEPLIQQHGPISITYGYIAPALSQQIVKYQDPQKPSYHRGDAGAAVDVCVHAWVNQDRPPIELVRLLHHQGYPYSRLITYAESEIICMATRLSERHGVPRHACYENRYVGVRKPQVVQHRTPTLAQPLKLTHPWRGRGYPSYHGGGRRQFEHIRLSAYTLLSDFLYDRDGMQTGKKNIPALFNAAFWPQARRAGALIDQLVALTGYKPSIVAGISPAQPWLTGYYLELVPPQGRTTTELLDILATLVPVTGLAQNKTLNRVRVSVPA